LKQSSIKTENAMCSDIFRQHLSFNAYCVFNEHPHEALQKSSSESAVQDIFSESYCIEHVDIFQ